jgi:hypothetical protein
LQSIRNLLSSGPDTRGRFQKTRLVQEFGTDRKAPLSDFEFKGTKNGAFSACPNCLSKLRKGQVLVGIVTEGPVIRAIVTIRKQDAHPPKVVKEPAGYRGPYLFIQSGETVSPETSMLSIFGSDFSPGMPVTLYLDGRVAAASLAPDKSGMVHWSIDIHLLPSGTHNLVAKQANPKQTLRTAAMFNFTQGERPHEEDKERH